MNLTEHHEPLLTKLQRLNQKGGFTGFNGVFRNHGVWLVMVWLLVIALCAWQVAVVHDHRQRVAHWQSLEKQQLQLQQEFGRLMLERSALSALSRVERVAKDELNMQEPDDVQVIAPNNPYTLRTH